MAPVGRRQVVIGLPPAQLRNRMVVSARRIIVEHWPRADRCPLPGVWVGGGPVT